MAEVLGTSVGEIFLLNFFYETSAFCTGILAVDPKRKILHGRNLCDSNILQNLTFIAKYQRNNEVKMIHSNY